MRVVLQSLANCALYLAQDLWLGSGCLAEGLRKSVHHEPVRLLVERKAARFTTGTGDASGRAGEADEVIRLAAKSA